MKYIVDFIYNRLWRLNILLELNLFTFCVWMNYFPLIVFGHNIITSVIPDGRFLELHPSRSYTSLKCVRVFSISIETLINYIEFSTVIITSTHRSLSHSFRIGTHLIFEAAREIMWKDLLPTNLWDIRIVFQHIICFFFISISKL